LLIQKRVRLGRAAKPRKLARGDVRASVEEEVKKQKAVREKKESELASQAVAKKKGVQNRGVIINANGNTCTHLSCQLQRRRRILKQSGYLFSMARRRRRQ
jgi:hypothetical protein